VEHFRDQLNDEIVALLDAPPVMPPPPLWCRDYTEAQWRDRLANDLKEYPDDGYAPLGAFAPETKGQ
jgi:hypothetical protein